MSVNRSSASQSNVRFTERRWRRRRRSLIALCVLILLLSGGIVYGLRQSEVRISHVQMFGADQSFAEIATATMRGSYFGLIPRDSTFFFPASTMRADIIRAHPDIAAVSIFRNGLTGLSIKVNDRVPIARWCGAPPDATRLDPVASNTDCYLFDASGFIYAATSTAQLVNSFVVYGSWESQISPETPIGSTLPNADKLPAAFDFAREINTFGSPVTSVVIRGDEVDDYLKSGTRVTYVLGNEQNAFTALVSARESFDLADGSIDYIDLRFDRKVYLKQKK